MLLKGLTRGQSTGSPGTEVGATDEEIAEALRLAYYVSGMDVIKTSLNAFHD